MRLRLLWSALGFHKTLPVSTAHLGFRRPTNGRISEAGQGGEILSHGCLGFQSNLVLQLWHFAEVEGVFKATKSVSGTSTKVAKVFGFRLSFLVASMAEPSGQNRAWRILFLDAGKTRSLADLDSTQNSATQPLVDLPIRVEGGDTEAGWTLSAGVVRVSASKGGARTWIWTQTFGPASSFRPGEMRVMMTSVASISTVVEPPWPVSTSMKIVGKEQFRFTRVWDWAWVLGLVSSMKPNAARFDFKAQEQVICSVLCPNTPPSLDPKGKNNVQ